MTHTKEQFGPDKCDRSSTAVASVYPPELTAYDRIAIPFLYQSSTSINGFHSRFLFIIDCCTILIIESTGGQTVRWVNRRALGNNNL